MTWEERIANYLATLKFAQPTMGVCNDKVYGTWEIGNNYSVASGYYGGYPATYLKRIAALFPERKRVLHLFSGRVDTATLPGDTVDLDAAALPTYLDDAQSLAGVPLWQYDLICCDPPYSVEDCDHYLPSMVKRNKVFKALERCRAGTWIVWLDQVSPMYSKTTWEAKGTIGVSLSTNHRFRCVRFYKRRGFDPAVAQLVEDL